VVAEGGRTTLACCIRRDRLRACRETVPGAAAGEAVAEFLHRSCAGVRDALVQSRQLGPWLSVGPIRPGIRVERCVQAFRVGNAAGESHPLIGEGIGMALQSAHMLAGLLSGQRACALDARRTQQLTARYAKAWRAAFAPRVRFAAAAAHAAMQPQFASLSHALVRRWPTLLTRAARWAGKTRHYIAVSEERTRGLPRERLSADARLDTLGMDSLSLLELMFKIEDGFHVKIPGDPPTGLRTVQDVVAYIDGLIADRSVQAAAGVAQSGAKM